MTFVETIQRHITEILSAELVEIVDNTWQHAGHSGSVGGSHLKITVVSSRFEGVPLLEQHRMVHQCLKDHIGSSIHALELLPFTPSAWARERSA